MSSQSTGETMFQPALERPQWRARAAAIAVAGGIVFAGLAGPASADTGSCGGVVGQPISHPEYFCNGFTVPTVHPSASDDEVKKAAICIVDFSIATRLGGFDAWSLGTSAATCGRDIIFGW